MERRISGLGLQNLGALCQERSAPTLIRSYSGMIGLHLMLEITADHIAELADDDLRELVGYYAKPS